ncbi:unnamed protein product, partial [Didymodactylos carnosus]
RKSDKVEEYEAIKNFNDAKTTENCVLIFEGDYGGQIYLTCPMKYVQCNEQILKQLLNDIDKLQWDDEEGCRMYYEIHKIGDDIIGGMSGGHVNDHLWIHDEINTEIKQQIQDVIDGKKEKIYI